MGTHSQTGYRNQPQVKSVVTQMPILTRVFSWISVQMGYAPLFISAAMVDEPLEDVVEVMRKFARSAIDVL